MTNRLEDASSPYLLQHADNPVDWYPWGKEALEKARQEDKPIFLSIGYAACHWCHVMAHESFEDPGTASFMNDHFVNIKVDREERPDLDSIYMQATVAMTGQGGWPMSVFLTPDGKPFFAGTYFPPVQRYNMPSFKQVLTSVANAWNEQRDQLLQNGEQIAQRLRSSTFIGRNEGQLDPKTLEKAAMTLAQSYDWKNGGWGSAPKFPQPMAIEFLLRQASRGDKMARDVATHALHSMSKGGMYDVVGGGFARYSVDDKWLVPHFEKMLYDNAQLARVYLYAYLITGEKNFFIVCERTLDFVLREMSHPDGGFYSSLDADSEGEEGKFYLWTTDEIEKIIKNSKEIQLFKAAYDITPEGNFEGQIVLQRVLDDESLSEQFGIEINEIPKRLERLNKKLLDARIQRVRPATDDKVLVAWNALMLTAFSEAGKYLGREDYTQAAARNAQFILNQLHDGGRLLRAWREGQANHNAYLEDYAALIIGLISLYQSDPDPRWFSWSMRLAQDMVANFQDPKGGFFDTRDDHEKLITRPKDIQDNATPSGNAMAATALLNLSTYTGKTEWREIAEDILIKLQHTAVRHPTAFAQWLNALDFALGEVHEVVILGDPDDHQTKTMVDALWDVYRPRMVAAISNHPPGKGSPALVQDRPLLDNLPTAYVCQDFVCLSPVNHPDDLKTQLEGVP